MTFATIIGPKNTHHYEASPFEVTNQKLPKIAIYPRNLGYSQKKSKKILSVLKKRPKINVFQLIWEVNGPKLSNLVTKVKNSPNYAKNRQKPAKNDPQTTHRLLCNRTGNEDRITTRDITRFQKIRGKIPLESDRESKSQHDIVNRPGVAGAVVQAALLELWRWRN